MSERVQNVFLSYARPDQAIAQKLAGQLRRAGFRVWDPEVEILPGDDFTGALRDALESADAMVVLVSPAAATSREVANEISYALGAKHLAGRLIPLLLSPAKSIPGMPWILNELQVVRYDGARSAGKRVAELLAQPTGFHHKLRRSSDAAKAEAEQRAG